MAKEFNTCEANLLFAATPPLEALRIILSEAATIDERSQKEDKVIMINDVARAFFEAPVKRDVCVELPEEALSEKEKEMDLVGKLEMSLYGTRDAAANFQEEIAKFMSQIGYKQGKYNPCTYWHEKRKLRKCVH